MPPSLSLDQQAIADLFDAHMLAELDGDLDGTLATMVEDPHLLNLPSGTGGLGAEGVRAFDANDLIGQFPPPPPDAVFIPISRTIDGERLLAATGKG
jgi:carboxymethylenebutenolidase